MEGKKLLAGKASWQTHSENQLGRSTESEDPSNLVWPPHSLGRVGMHERVRCTLPGISTSVH
jgi:hypothetical protein